MAPATPSGLLMAQKAQNTPLQLPPIRQGIQYVQFKGQLPPTASLLEHNLPGTPHKTKQTNVSS